MALAGAPSLREIRARAKTALEAATLPNTPNIVDSPVNPTDDSSLPEVHLFDGGRNATGNGAQKLFRGAVTLSLGVEVTVRMKGTYADALDELTDAVIQVLLTSDSVLQDIGKIESYNTRPEYERAEVPLARNIITINMSTQEKFVTTTSGNPAALQEVKSTVDIGGEDTQNITATFRPPQT